MHQNPSPLIPLSTSLSNKGQTTRVQTTTPFRKPGTVIFIALFSSSHCYSHITSQWGKILFQSSAKWISWWSYCYSNSLHHLQHGLELMNYPNGCRVVRNIRNTYMQNPISLISPKKSDKREYTAILVLLCCQVLSVLLAQEPSLKTWAHISLFILNEKRLE